MRNSPSSCQRTVTLIRSYSVVIGKKRADEEFIALYEQHFERCVRVAHNVAFDTSTAEDLAVESFTRAYARWNRLRHHPSPSAWAVRTTINLAIDQNRRQSPQPSPIDSPDHASSTDTRLVLKECLQQLSGRQQAVVVLRHLIGLPTREVAQILNTSEGSVKTHLHRATQRLEVDLVAAGLREGKACV